MYPSPFAVNATPISASYDVLCVELAATPTSAQFSGALQIASIPPDYRQRSRQPEWAIPEFNIALGSLLVLLQADRCVAVGAVTHDVDGERPASCRFTVWPIDIPLYFHPRRYIPGHTQPTRPAWYECQIQHDGNTLAGKITRLDEIAAQQLRALIGPAAPELVAAVFWSEQERALFSAQADAQDNFINGANALFDKLPA